MFFVICLNSTKKSTGVFVFVFPYCPCIIHMSWPTFKRGSVQNFDTNFFSSCVCMYRFISFLYFYNQKYCIRMKFILVCVNILILVCFPDLAMYIPVCLLFLSSNVSFIMHSLIHYFIYSIDSLNGLFTNCDT